MVECGLPQGDSSYGPTSVMTSMSGPLAYGHDAAPSPPPHAFLPVFQPALLRLTANPDATCQVLPSLFERISSAVPIVRLLEEPGGLI
jgi:hypothetical protein